MIAIVDYGMGNLRSVQKALEHVGADARIAKTPAELEGADKIVLPGVGAFVDAIDRLHSAGLAQPLIQAVDTGLPFLGICLGLQLLFDISCEDGEHKGLGILPGKVERFTKITDDTGQSLSIPHMGWNQLFWERDCPLLAGIEQGAYAYFAHSYYVAPADEAITCTTTEYGSPFTSSVWKDNLFATQFHPEKSQAVGLKILENFVRL